nr:unnamed protein product [Callosobruchus chinensis]
MVFEIEGKVALITGGASGLGLRYAEELLKNGLKAVVLADCDSEQGKASEENLNKIFGEGRALFVKTDVSDMKEFEDAFNETIKHYDHVDILINNAGIMDDSIWEREISVNMKGNIHGLILGMEKFLKTYRQSEEAVIVNISSVCGIECYGFLPVYCSIKLAIIGMTRVRYLLKQFSKNFDFLYTGCVRITC